MAGHGPAPKEDRVRRVEPERGDIQHATSEGWRHGDVPSPPDGLMAASVEAWDTWFSSWFASFWTKAELPGLRQLVRLYDQVERGEFQRAGELRLQMDTYGITPKGQQDRRWKPPKPAPQVVPTQHVGSHYGHLKAV